MSHPGSIPAKLGGRADPGQRGHVVAASRPASSPHLDAERGQHLSDAPPDVAQPDHDGAPPG